jgi:hypothetical protein
MSKKAICGFTLVVSLLVSGTVSQSQESVGDGAACTNFVQKFYDWYLAKSNQKNMKLSPFEIAVQQKSQWFSPELIKELKEDLRVSAKSPGEVVGLDFDPFLNAQDVATRYGVGKATSRNGKWYVDVYGTWNGKKNAKPDVVPELTCNKGIWIFTNFDYPGPPKSNLFAVLKQLRDERKQMKL